MPSEKILNAKKEQVKNLAEKFKKAKMIVLMQKNLLGLRIKWLLLGIITKKI